MEPRQRVRPIGPVAIALRALNASRAVVIGAWVVSVVGIVAGLVLLAA